MDTETMEAAKRLIPPHCQHGLLAYIEHRNPVGDFLTAVLENKLFEAFGHADRANKFALADYVEFLYNHAPPLCYGSPAKVTAWLERHDEQRFSVDRLDHCKETLTRKTLLSDDLNQSDMHKAELVEWVATAKVGDKLLTFSYRDLSAEKTTITRVK